MRFSFFGLGLALFNLGFNLYIASWLFRRIRPGVWGRFLIIEAALLLSAFYPVARSLGRSQDGGFFDGLLWLAYFCFGASFILCWSLMVFDLALAALSKARLAKSRGLPAALDGFSVIQISDTHLGRMNGLDRLEKIAAASDAANPDLVPFA